MSGGGEASTTCTSPAAAAAVAGPPPLYGMCVILMPTMLSNTSVARCHVLPTPGVLYERCVPGCFAYSMNSFSDFTGRFEFTEKSRPPLVTRLVTGMKSFSVSYGRLLCTYGLITKPDE